MAAPYWVRKAGGETSAAFKQQADSNYCLSHVQHDCIEPAINIEGKIQEEFFAIGIHQSYKWI
jgi:hypothetical protein